MKKKYNQTYHEIGARLRSIREEWQLNKQDMAARLGVTYESYLKYEGGKVFSNPLAMHRLLTEHGFSLDWFLFGKGPKHFMDKGEKDELVKEVTEPLEKTITQLREEMNQLREKTTQLRQEEIAQLQENVTNREEEIAQLQEDVTNRSEEITQLKMKLEASTEQNEKLEKELTAEKTARAALPEMNEDLKELVVQMNRDSLLRYEILLYYQRLQRKVQDSDDSQSG